MAFSCVADVDEDDSILDGCRKFGNEITSHLSAAYSYIRNYFISGKKVLNPGGGSRDRGEDIACVAESVGRILKDGNAHVATVESIRLCSG